MILRAGSAHSAARGLSGVGNVRKVFIPADPGLRPAAVNTLIDLAPLTNGGRRLPLSNYLQISLQAGAPLCDECVPVRAVFFQLNINAGSNAILAELGNAKKT